MPEDPKLSEIIAEGYHYLQGFCPSCHMWRTMGLDRLTVAPGGKIKPNTKLSELVARLRCKNADQRWRRLNRGGRVIKPVTPYRALERSEDDRVSKAPDHPLR